MKARSEENLRLAHTLLQGDTECRSLHLRHAPDTGDGVRSGSKRREQALAAAAHLVSDWDGGTRIGEALQAFPRCAAASEAMPAAPQVVRAL